MFEHNWTIVGDDPFAAGLRTAARFVPSDRPLTLVTDASAATESAWVVGPAVVRVSSGRYAPYYGAFEAIEEVKRAVVAGEVGKIYGLFGSFRVSRATPAADVAPDALLPLVGVALDIIADPPARVWAANRSLMAAGDAWFVHLRTRNDILITLEALACCEPALGPELLVEVTGHDRVLRAEPMRQAVVVEASGASPAAYPWWEDLDERFLRNILARCAAPDDGLGERLRVVWDALSRSASTGEPVAIG